MFSVFGKWHLKLPTWSKCPIEGCECLILFSILLVTYLPKKHMITVIVISIKNPFCSYIIKLILKKKQAYLRKKNVCVFQVDNLFHEYLWHRFEYPNKNSTFVFLLKKTFLLIYNKASFNKKIFLA